MQGEIDKNFIDENGELDVNRLVLSTAIVAVFRVFILSTLIFVIFVSMLPWKAMRFFENIGLEDRALDMVNEYIAREEKKDTSAQSKYAYGLYYKMLMSEQLYYKSSDKKAKKYLQEIYESTYKYSQIQGIEEKNEQLDLDNLKYFEPLFHANVGSFTGRVSSLNYMASIRLNKNEFLIGSTFYTLDQIMQGLDNITENILQEELENTNKIPNRIAEFSIFFGQLSQYINFVNNNQSDELFSTTEFDLLIAMLQKKVKLFEAFALNLPDNFSQSHVETQLYVRQNQLYFVKNIALLYDNICEASMLSTDTKDVWKELRKTETLDDVSGERLTLSQYFQRVLLPQYINYYNITAS